MLRIVFAVIMLIVSKFLRINFCLQHICLWHFVFLKNRKSVIKLSFQIVEKFFGTPTNSRLPMFFKIGVLKTFAKFTGKHQYWSLFLIRLLGSAFNFVKKETLAQVFSSKFYEIYRNASGGCFWMMSDLVAQASQTCL